MVSDYFGLKFNNSSKFIKNSVKATFFISLPAISRKITFDGIHAKYVPWTMTNITRVDAKREFSI